MSNSTTPPTGKGTSFRSLHDIIQGHGTLEELIEASRNIKATEYDREEQRRSFAAGNVGIDNPRVTRGMVDEVARLATSLDPKKD